MRYDRIFGGVVLNHLSARHVSNYVQARRESGNAEGTIRRELALICSALNFAKKHWEWDLPNPFPGRMPIAGAGRIRWLTPEEAEKLLAAARKRKRTPQLVWFIELGLHTGMRSQEMLGLEWSRVDLDQRVVYLPAAKNKGRRNVSVPLNATACRVLAKIQAWHQEHQVKSEWVFCRKTTGERLMSLKKAFHLACKAAGLADFTPHDLRHTCASWLVQRGVSIAQIRDLLRHTSIQVTEKYAHLRPEASREAVDGLGQA